MIRRMHAALDAWLDRLIDGPEIRVVESVEAAEHWGSGITVEDVRRVSGGRDVVEPVPIGCICPPTSEKTCQGIMCPRRGLLD